MKLANIDLTPILQAVIALIGALITWKVIPWIQARTTKEQRANIQAVINTLVFAAEQLYGAGEGAKKLDYVCERLKEKGYKVDRAEIEAAVYKAFNGITIIPDADTGADHPPDVKDAIALESLPYESLVLFALDNGFGAPEDGELHGQNKEEIRQSMLEWLEKRLTEGKTTGD